jgi:hypothetical protein
VVTKSTRRVGPLTRLADEARRRASDFVSDFQAQDRYFKMQAGLVTGWVLISLLTIGVVAKAGNWGNHLGAEVRAEQAVGGSLIFVTNTSGARWTDITYRLNDEYIYRQATLAPGDHAALPVGRFRKGGITGPRAPPDISPKKLFILSRQGTSEFKL